MIAPTRRLARPALAAFAAATMLTCAANAPAATRRPATTPEDATLQGSLARIAARAHGRCAIAAWHFQPDGSGLQVAEVNADRPQVMASVYKLPIAAKVLADADAGRLAMDRTLTLRPADDAPGWSPIAAANPQGVTISIAALVDSVVTTSDNTACDVLLDQVGGPRAVTAWLRAQGIAGIRVDRSERQIGIDYAGPAPRSVRRATAQRAAAASAFARDPRDHASAHALATLLHRLWLGGLLSDSSRARLLSAMERAATGPRRLRAGLPREARLFHKTGTGFTTGGVTAAINDVGLVKLPGGGGIVVIAVLVEDARGGEAAEDTIAEVARVVYDHWNAPD